ncbi:hypothetical protein [Salipaludibacillus keqinensis]|uniref:hypothetical protein n=1 Tax=Salipaludibacillus keqinensis TaxID=2045207 RepID=UPI001304F124|nr:hypothetical protein [Salipaludibacillus keqinensis]
MDLLTVLILIVVGIILLRIVGAIFRVIITLGVILLIVYIIQQVVTVNMIHL